MKSGVSGVVVSLLAFACAAVFATGAQAGGLAVPGEIYATATQDNPAGSLPGGDSGTDGEPADRLLRPGSGARVGICACAGICTRISGHVGHGARTGRR